MQQNEGRKQEAGRQQQQQAGRQGAVLRNLNKRPPKRYPSEAHNSA